MEEIPLSRTYLESLATCDLVKTAEDLGIDVQDNPDRVSIIEELLEASSGDEDGSSRENEMADSVMMEAVPLPRNYNITFIDVMIRDPFWAFVFWEIKSSDSEQFEKAEDFSGYYLKVSPLENQDSSPCCEEAFTVPVKTGDTAWYLCLAPIVKGESLAADQYQYKVEYCAGVGGVETVLAVSNPVRLPAQPHSGAEKQDNTGICGNQLMHLSGYCDLHVLRNNERLLRAKKGSPACSNE